MGEGNDGIEEDFEMKTKKNEEDVEENAISSRSYRCIMKANGLKPGSASHCVGKKCVCVDRMCRPNEQQNVAAVICADCLALWPQECA